MRYWYLYLLLAALLIVLASCAQKECDSSSDCDSRSAFTASCAKGKCVYSPIPDICGNGKCEPPGETKGNCADCGSCSGKVANSKLLIWQPVMGKCVESVSNAKQIIVANDVASAGDKFHFDSAYLQPFNLRKDKFDFTVQFDQGVNNKDAVLLDAELSGALDKRRVVLARKTINRPLIEGVSLKNSLILDFPMNELDGELSNLVLKARYQYISSDRAKESVVQISYKDKFVVVNPSSEFPCPKCDDNNPATRDFCNERNFCEYEPNPDVCGNGLCDGVENKCTCAKDCGVCSGGSSATFYSCKANQCVASLRESVVLIPHNVFESRDIGPIKLENNYRFTTPHVVTSPLNVDLKKYGAEPSVSKITIETVRLLEGSQILAELQVNQELGSAPLNLAIMIPLLPVVEKEASVTVAVWYSYVQNEKTESGMFQKSLGKILIVSPNDKE